MNLIPIFAEGWPNRRTLIDTKRSSELAAFLPAILEIQETPPNPVARWLSRTILVLLASILVWACFGSIDIVASAEGKIIPGSRVKQIQPLEKGVVKAILISEGAYVTKGQALIELDGTVTAATKNRLMSELYATTLGLAVDQALLGYIEATVEYSTADKSAPRRDELSLSVPATTSSDDVTLYEDLLWEQWRQYWSQYQSLQSSVLKTRAEKAASKEVVVKLEKTLPIVTKRVAILEQLKQKDFVSEVEYLDSEEARIQNQQDLATERQRYQQLIAAESEVQEQINTHIAQASAMLLTKVADQRRQISALREEITKATNLDDKQILYAPVDGRVQQLATNTIGGVVTEAQVLMIIVPEEDLLEAEVFLENKDIGFVDERMLAEIKVHTFPFTKYGVIDATVTSISDDAIVDEQRGLIYGMRLRMKENTIMVKGKRIRLKPGMAVTAEVRTGTRRVIEYFLAPLLRMKNESIRER